MESITGGSERCPLRLLKRISFFLFKIYIFESFSSRSSPPYVFLWKGVLKICSKFTGEHSCQSVVSIKLPSSFIEIALRHGWSPVKLLHIFRTPFPRNTSRWLLLSLSCWREERRLQALMIDDGQYYCRVKIWLRLEKFKKLNTSLVDLMMENTVVE